MNIKNNTNPMPKTLGYDAFKLQKSAFIPFKEVDF